MTLAPGHRLVASDLFRAAIARRLGLPVQGATASGWSLAALEGVWPDRIRLQLAHPQGSLLCYLRPPGTAECYLATDRLAISYVGHELPAGMDRLLDHVAQRLDGWGFAGLMARLLASREPPTSESSDSPRPAHARNHEPQPDSERGEPSDPPSSFSGPGSFSGPPDVLEACWRRFICGTEFPELDGPRWVDPAMVSLQYGDRECSHAEPQEGPAFWNFFNFPEQGPAAAAELRPLSQQRVVNIELDEEAVVLGTEAIQDRLLAAAEAVAPEAVAFVFDQLCTPVVIGDDLAALTERCRGCTGRPVVPLSFEVRDRGEGFQSLMAAVGPELSARSPAGAEEAAADPKTVNLLGFAARYRQEELEPVLEALGLSVRARLLPDLRVAELHKLAGAGWNIQPRGSRFARMLEEALGEAEIPALEVPAPYGVAATQACYERIAAATGCQEALPTAWASCWEPARVAWAQAVNAARRQRLALVVDEQGWDQLAAPERLGIPLVAMLQEMGFALDVLRYAPLAKEDPPPAVADALDRVLLFADRAELQERLRDSGCQAVYSDLYFDWRLTGAGCGQFSRQDLEPGVAGGLRSLQRLLAICATPFYRRYARYLAPPEEPTDA